MQKLRHGFPSKIHIVLTFNTYADRKKIQHTQKNAKEPAQGRGNRTNSLLGAQYLAICAVSIHRGL